MTERIEVIRASGVRRTRSDAIARVINIGTHAPAGTPEASASRVLRNAD